MIKINLARRRQQAIASGVGVDEGGGIKTKINFDALRSMGESGGRSLAPYLLKAGVPLLVCVIAHFGYDYYVQGVREELAKEIQSFEDDKVRINKELTKIKGFESQKAELERTATIIRAKIDTIENLIKGRDFTSKAIMSLVQSLPKDAWIIEFSQTEKQYTLRGAALDLGNISDLMSRLQHTIYFKDVTLRSTASDPSLKRINFELSARRD